MQTVSKETNPRYHALISLFEEKTECPVVVNTSFNIRGEPIVGTPVDAFRCFMGTEMDTLVVGNYYMRKEDQEANLIHDYKDQFKLDYIDRHPFKGQVRLKTQKPRDRYVTDEEYNQLMATQGYDIMKLFIEFAVLTGLRKGDALTLKRTDLKEDGIHTHISKTNGKQIIKWTPALKNCVDRILALRSIDITLWLFCKQDGGCYYIDGKSSGFDTMWKRFREKAGLPDVRIHDLRAKTASDFEDEKDAQNLLSHSSLSMTKAYIRKPKTVRPLK